MGSKEHKPFGFTQTPLLKNRLVRVEGRQIPETQVIDPQSILDQIRTTKPVLKLRRKH